MADINECCDTCITKLMDNITPDDLLFLESLRKNKAVSDVCSLQKTKIIAEMRNVTDFSFNLVATRLLFANIINKSVQKRIVKYYITKSGLRLLQLYKLKIKSDMESAG